MHRHYLADEEVEKKSSEITDTRIQRFFFDALRPWLARIGFLLVVYDLPMDILLTLHRLKPPPS